MGGEFTYQPKRDPIRFDQPHGHTQLKEPVPPSDPILTGRMWGKEHLAQWQCPLPFFERGCVMSLAGCRGSFSKGRDLMLMVCPPALDTFQLGRIGMAADFCSSTKTKRGPRSWGTVSPKMFKGKHQQNSTPLCGFEVVNSPPLWLTHPCYLSPTNN